jgi:hypothetical protein
MGFSVSDAIYSVDWLPWVHRHALRYDLTRPITLVGEGHHEWPGAILTTVIVSAPLIALWGITLRSADRSLSAIATAAALITLGLVFASRGGTGYLLNEFITPALRGQARLMPLLMFLAIFIVVSAADIALLYGGRPRQIAVAAVVAGMLASSAAVSGVLTTRQQWNLHDPAVRKLMTSYTGLIAAKNQNNLTTILQLPLASWPEIPARNGFDFYTHHYGAIFDTPGSHTRWSYATSIRQPGFADLEKTIQADTDPQSLPARATKAGFDGILIEKKPYAVGELQALLAGIGAAVPASCRLYDDSDRVLYEIGRCHQSDLRCVKERC